MIDTIGGETESADGEAAYYVLEGLVPLYAGTRDPAVLACARRPLLLASLDLLLRPAQGEQRRGSWRPVLRMDDYPLLYPIGPAKAMTLLLELHALTNDRFTR